jgi:ubiquinone/menaquinone biosynthesis C-methylase UbiE
MIKDLIPFNNFLSYRHKRFWLTRDINWEESYFTPDHPKNDLLVEVLKNIRFGSIVEVGCASGGNLARIKREFPDVEVGGIDISPQAIEEAKRLIGDYVAVLEVSPAHKIFLSDKSVDVVMTNMCLIYVDPFHIKKTIKEIKRISRSYVIFVEFHNEHWFNRLVCRLFNGYNMYNYYKLLSKHGFHDIVSMEVVDLKLHNGKKITHQLDVYLFGRRIKVSAHLILAKI